MVVFVVPLCSFLMLSLMVFFSDVQKNEERNPSISITSHFRVFFLIGEGAVGEGENLEKAPYPAHSPTCG